MSSINIYDVIRHNIKKYRKEKNITQAELAERCRVSHDYIRQIESDKVAKTFSVQTLYYISLVLDINPGMLFEIEWNTLCEFFFFMV